MPSVENYRYNFLERSRKLKIRLESKGGRWLAKENFLKRKSIAKLISLLGTFYRKINQVGNVKSFIKELQENIIDKEKEDSGMGREIILKK